MNNHEFLRHLIDSTTCDLRSALSSPTDSILAQRRHLLFKATLSLVSLAHHLETLDLFPPEERRPLADLKEELDSFFSRTDVDILYSKELL